MRRLRSIVHVVSSAPSPPVTTMSVKRRLLSAWAIRTAPIPRHESSHDRSEARAGAAGAVCRPANPRPARRTRPRPGVHRIAQPPVHHLAVGDVRDEPRHDCRRRAGRWKSPSPDERRPRGRPLSRQTRIHKGDHFAGGRMRPADRRFLPISSLASPSAATTGNATLDPPGMTGAPCT